MCSSDLDGFGSVDSGRLVTLAGLAAQKGRVGDGVDIMEDIHRWATASGRAMALPKQIGLATGGISDAIAGPVSWVFLTALSGANFDARLQRLTLSPRIPEGWDRLEMPVFTPAFRGWLSYEAPSYESAHRISFRLDEIRDGRSLELKQIATRVPSALWDQNPMLFLEGAPRGGGVSRRSLGLLTLVLDEPLRLARRGPGALLQPGLRADRGSV